jgi:hypothetical protein
MERIEEFTIEGRNFIYFDLSGLQTNDEFTGLIEASKPIVEKHGERSLYTITNIAGVRFDTKTKTLTADWMAHNKPYVKHGVVIGMDSIKRIMVNAVFALSGRENMSTAASKEEAVERLLGRG